ncbi:Uncharacterized protein APZ42_000680 [Daphnia magna]|uniref:DDE Tnp4 domain-containing protein n=1 Tax=Daphnia magna TaxID=35525 RepID=A0A164JGN5_9CRUS|nr:Uncharacterized protein APZ42_000680 [Daphnia magna]
MYSTHQTIRCLTPIEQILVALQFYATRTFQSTVGNVLKISQPSVSKCVRDVSKALCDITSEHISLEIQRGFLANLRDVVWSGDGTHRRIARPHHDEDIYVNRKGYHSINVQGIFDEKCNFFSAFRNNKFGQSYVLGDSGYACTPFLLPPYSQPQGKTELYLLPNKFA